MNAQRHVVQFYAGNEPALAGNVAAFLAEGLARGEGALIIAGAANRDAILAALEARTVETGGPLASTPLASLDAEETLAAFLIDGRPDRRRFRETVGAQLRAFKGASVRAYGEMVGVLWQRGERRAAAQLEELWNELLARETCRLFCGYPVDVFGDGFEPTALDEVLCAHTQLVPALADDLLANAIERAMDEILAGSSAEMRRLMKLNYRPAWAAIPRGEGLALWLRNNLLPDAAGAILARAKTFYRACA